MTVVIGLAIAACAGFIFGGCWQWWMAREVLADAAEYAEELEIAADYWKARACGYSPDEAHAMAVVGEMGRQWDDETGEESR